MNTTHPRKKSAIAAVGAAVAAAAAPAFLFAGAGTAQAGTWVNTISDALGVTVHVLSVGRPSSGWCTYPAAPIVPPASRAGLRRPVLSAAERIHDLWFPGIQSGTTWNVDVHCPSAVTPGSSR